MLRFLQDQDYRVRHGAALFVPRRFELMHSKEFKPAAYWRQLREYLDLDSSELEVMLTGSLCMINTLVISEEIRPRAYHNLLKILVQPQELSDQIIHHKLTHENLKRASATLGFATIGELYKFYAAHIAVERHHRQDPPLDLNSNIIGHQLDENQKAELLQVHVLAASPFPYLDDRPNAFQDHVRLAGLPKDQALQLCLPTVAAELLAWACTSAELEAVPAIDYLIEKPLRDMATESGLGRDVMKCECDWVVVHLMRLPQIKHEDLNLISEFVIQDPAKRNVFEVLTSKLRKYSLCQPTLPSYPILRIAQAMNWLGARYSVTREAGVIYNIICNSFALLTTSYFTNHRLRILYALSIYISLSHMTICNSLPILSLLLQALTPLLSNDDIFQAVCNFLRWTLAKILQPSNSSLKGHASIGHLIISVVEVMKRVADSTSSQEADICTAKEFNSWLLKHVSKTSKSGGLEYQRLCQSLMLHWPERHDIPVDNDAIKAVLTSAPGPTFQLIHHLSEYNFPPDADETGQLLYRLLASAEELKTELKIEDCQAYLKLVYLNSGILRSPRLGQSTPPNSKSNPEGLSLDSERQIVSQIFSIVILLLQTSDFQLVRSFTEFLQRATSYEVLPDFSERDYSIAPLLLERAVLTCHRSNVREYRVHSFSKRQPLDFSSLSKLAHSSRDWTCGFLKLLIASRAEARPFYTQLIPLVQANDELAAKFLPHVLHSCLLDELGFAQNELRTNVSRHINTVLASSSTHQNVIARILELATQLRYHRKPGDDALGNDTWLDVPWIELAKHASQQGMSASSFLFIEIAREHGLFIDLSKPLEEDVRSLFEHLCSISPEPDAFYSLIPSDPRKFLLQRFQHEQQWQSAFEFHGAMLEGTNVKSRTFAGGFKGVASYLSSYGLNRLAHTILHTRSFGQDDNSTYSGETDESSTLTFELAWRASIWDLPAADQLNVDSSTRVYGTLKSCHEDREKSVQLNISKSCLLGQFKELIKTASAGIQPSSQAIASTLALGDVVSWLDRREGNPESLVNLPLKCPFDVLERISAIRRSLLQTVNEQMTSKTTSDEIQRRTQAARKAELKLRIETSRAARHAGQLHVAVNVITPFADLTEKEMGSLALNAQEEFAEVLWAKGEHGLALNTMKAVQALQKNLPESAVQLCRIGEWISLARLNSPDKIFDEYFQKAIQILERAQQTQALGQASHTYARFADEQYHKLLESGEAKRLSESIKRLQAEITAIESFSDSDEAEELLERKQMRHEEESDKLRVVSDLQTRYLTSSLKMYLASLANCDQHDDSIFRFVSLWLEHHSNDELNKVIRSPVRSVPTHKFIRVAHQLLARMSKESHSEFQRTLTQLIIDLGKDHPFHIIFQILLLQRGIASACLDGPSNSRSRRTSQISSTPSNALSSSDLSRALAADSVLTQLYQHESRKEVVQQLITVHKAYKEWALYPLPPELKKRPKLTQIPAKMLLNDLKDLSVPVPTARIPIDITCQYSPESMPCISLYDTKFKPASGVHAPKITNCRGSNGAFYTQLFKGGDDVRQDAIMEQVFELVNEVLTRDPECQKRRLRFKTYNVIPLSPDTGVIEFVRNTLPLMSILLPLHHKYNEPQDWSFQKMRAHLNTNNTQERIERYKEVMARSRPAMRFWFLETQKCPQKWYEMRLNFTRSTATTSIVGHILGLGDRHLSNILVDQMNGEVVQIDLGIAFDGGKLLPVPETVPFRLSRDTVDGFGVSRTEGVFRRCCEQTLRVLRENKSLIMTIIDVLKHDPLRPWIITAQRERKLQGFREDLEKKRSKDRENLGEPNAQGSEEASRALATVESKLSSDLSVETTVNQLILEATSIENLGSLFYGWSAFY